MKRMYYLASDLDGTEQIAHTLHQAVITDRHFHVISKDEAGLYRRHLQRANLFQKHDIIRYGERGALLGLALAVLVTGYAWRAEIFGAGASGFIYLIAFAFITLFGAWLGGLTGLASENQAIAQFHDQIDSGKCLILIDLRGPREDAIRSLMAAKHPDARLVHVGSTLVHPFQTVRGTPA